MNQKTKKIILRLSQALAIILLVISFSQVKPQPAKAVWPVLIDLDVSWTGILNNISLVGTRLKEWGLDKIAYQMAKRALHQMTVDVVGWINTGYKGKPAFLTNPSGFFLDSADQVTGEFLRENGPLRNLCSPWSVDIRVSLALRQLQDTSNGIYEPRYTCTLGRIIRNSQNITVNGSSIEGFVGGNFNQGGWPAFIALTTEDRNNPVGLSLQVRSDQLYAIGNRQAAISADLQIGKGFLSWESCTDVPSTVDFEESPDSSIKMDTTTGKWQKCVTKTPGSVIADSLHDQLRTPTDELLLANDMNAIFDAAITQLVTQTLRNGLYSMNTGSSGTSASRAYLKQVYANATKPVTLTQPPGPNSSSDMQSLITAQSKYDNAIHLVMISKTNYETAQVCLINKISSGTVAQNTISGISTQISQINTALSSRVIPLLSTLTTARTTIASQISQRSGGQNITITGNDDLQTTLQTAISNYYNDFGTLTGANTGIPAIIGNPDQDLSTAEAQSGIFNTEADGFQLSCDGTASNNVRDALYGTDISTTTPFTDQGIQP
ncbi:MAG: hypothetical protein NT077_03440 [Candidatus Taylorbacteria bacterium]|nr:hypothetical protein [Candidatus Taylorbacteria bacterium]